MIYDIVYVFDGKEISKGSGNTIKARPFVVDRARIASLGSTTRIAPLA